MSSNPVDFDEFGPIKGGGKLPLPFRRQLVTNCHQLNWGNWLQIVTGWLVWPAVRKFRTTSVGNAGENI